MKKFLCIPLLCMCTMVASAQVQVGVKAGLNVADINATGLTYNSYITYSSKINFNAGFLVTIPLFKSFLLQPEILYSGQGANTLLLATSLITSYDYLNFPVLFKYQQSSGFFAETGPQIGFLLDAFEKGGYQGTVDLTNEVQPIDFSWAFGIGCKFKKPGIGFDLRYNLGLTNTEEGGTHLNGVSKNSVFQIGLFYMFRNH
jgi:Outer membrane protein beta-barrel domain